MDTTAFYKQNWLDAYAVRNKTTLTSDLDRQFYGGALHHTSSWEFMLERLVEYLGQVKQKYDGKRNRLCSKKHGQKLFFGKSTVLATGLTATEPRLEGSLVYAGIQVDLNSSSAELLYFFKEMICSMRQQA